MMYYRDNIRVLYFISMPAKIFTKSKKILDFFVIYNKIVMSKNKYE